MFIEEHEYKYAPDGRILIDKEGYERWAEGQRRIPGLKYARDQSASTSETKRRRAANPCTPVRPTSSTQLACASASAMTSERDVSTILSTFLFRRGYLKLSS